MHAQEQMHAQMQAGKKMQRQMQTEKPGQMQMQRTEQKGPRTGCKRRLRQAKKKGTHETLMETVH